MRTLVTGGAGFIGSWVVDQLVSQGSDVYVLDNLDPQVHPSGEWPEYINDGAHYMRGDVRDPADVRASLFASGAEAVVHLAAKVGVGQSMYDLTEYTSVNAYGTANLLEEIERIPAEARPLRLVVASSMSIYGEGAYGIPDEFLPKASEDPPYFLEGGHFTVAGTVPWVPKPTPETHPLKPASIYAIGKRDQEEMFLIFGRAYGIPTTALRFFNTYGPRQKLGNPYTGVVAIFASRLLNGKSPIIFGNGTQSRDFINVLDVARAVTGCLDPQRYADTDGLAINVGTGVATTVEEVARKLAYQLCLDVGVAWDRERAGDVQHCYADRSLAERKLGWVPEIDLDQGLRELLPWLEKQQHVVPDDGVDAAYALLQRHGLTR